MFSTQQLRLILRRILLIVWKNLILRKRHLAVTFFEIFLPTVLILILAYINSEIPRNELDNVNKQMTGGPANLQVEQPTSYSKLKGSAKGKFGNTVVAFAPKNEFTIAVVHALNSEIGGSQVISWAPYANESAVQKAASHQFSEGKRGDIVAAVVFQNAFNNPKQNQTNPISGKYSYKIRIADHVSETDRLFSTSLQKRILQETDGYDNYRSSGFSGLQVSLDKILIQMLTSANYEGAVITEFSHIQAMPPIPIDPVMVIILPVLAVFLSFGFIFIVPASVRELVSEKQSGIKELMRMMGLPNWMHLLGWIIDAMLVLILSVSVIIILLFVPMTEKGGSPIRHVNGFLCWVVLMTFCFQAVSMCIFIASFFEKGAYATTLGLVIWIMTLFGVANQILNDYESYGSWARFLLCAIPNVSLFLALKIMIEFEVQRISWGFKELFSPMLLYKDDWLSVGLILLMMLFSSAIYLLLSIYVENVMPATFGIHLGKKKVHAQDSNNVTQDDNKYVESDPREIQSGIEIVNLRKKYSNGTLAVNSLSLRILQGRITALLGHNGAGKTTVMSILTGMTTPTSGSATIDGHDIKTDLEGSRRSLGLCPQHNMLFDQLTVEEHLKFFATLKGASSQNIKPEMDYVLAKLGLADKQDAFAKNLSGGQKRKLNFAMALIGGSKVVILDEPTSGLDPASRRLMWDLLLETRGFRTILLSTHMMEEADVLGDRIAIMSKGKLKCYGSPMFLKQQFGAGYTLRFVLLNKAQKNNILETVRKFVSNGSFKGTPNNRELAIVLPGMEDTAIFTPLFADLETQKQKLGIESAGLSLTTMDEIFIKVVLMDEAPPEININSAQSANRSSMATPKDTVENAKVTKKGSKKSNLAPAKSTTTSTSIPTPKKSTNTASERKSQGNSTFAPESAHEVAAQPQLNLHSFKSYGLKLSFRRFYGLLMKRFQYSRRKISTLVIQILVLLLLIIWAIMATNGFRKPPQELPALKISLSSYNNPITAYVSDNKNLSKAYAFAAGISGKQVFGSLRQYLLSVAKDNFGEYRGAYIIGANLSEKGSTAHFSVVPAHARPLTINILSNAYLQYYSKDPKKEFSIEVFNHPLPTGAALIKYANNIAEDVFSNKFLLPIAFSSLAAIGLAVLAATFVTFPIEERVSKSKQLQLMTGVNSFNFWSASFLWDFLCAGIITCILLCVFPLFEIQKIFTQYYGMGTMAAILLTFGFSSIAFAYLVSLISSTSSGGFALITCINIFVGIFFSNIVHLLDTFGFSTASDFFRITGRIFPFYGIVKSLLIFTELVAENSRCSIFPENYLKNLCKSLGYDHQDRTCCDFTVGCRLGQNPFYDGEFMHFIPRCFEVKPYLTWENAMVTLDRRSKKRTLKQTQLAGIGQELCFSLIIALAFLILVVLIDWGIFKILFHFQIGRPTYSPLGNSFDSDVIEEANRVQLGVQNGLGKVTDIITVVGLTKNFDSFAAVSNLNFGVHRGECFGLLGVNGAGKTTTFCILTGDMLATSGNAFGGGWSLRRNRQNFLSQIGYCPQFDAIVGVLSGKEMLQLFSRLRGNVQTSKEVHKWLDKVGLLDSENVQCQNYSGGMKRRLSAAMALIGDPPIVMLDEPTSGVDPVARRHFWAIMRDSSAAGQAVILTSHSMDECEALCSRLAIMVNGQFQCFGGVQHIKTKYAQGLSYTIKLKPMIPENSPRIFSLVAEFEQQMSPCTLKDRHQNILEYQVFNSLPWGNIFEIMEGFKKRYPTEIENYVVSETTLDQVFLSFARTQYPARIAQGGGCCKK